VKALTITDLPKNYDFRYCPPRPTDFIVRRKGKSVEEMLSCSLQSPLVLKVGDVVLFAGELPSQFVELTKTTTGHGAYAVITEAKPLERSTEGEAGSSGVKCGESASRVEFIG
jgi:hypothetical protein